MGDLSRYSDEDIIGIVSSDFEKELRKRGYEHGWYKKEIFVGAIYILVNPAFSDLVKIGYADDVLKRLKTLNNNSGLPDPFHCYAVYKVKKRLEDLRLHSLIDTLDPSLRHAKNREFYEMDCEKAYDILSAIAQINGNEEQLIKNPFSDSYFDTQFTKVSENTDIVQTEKSPKKGRLKFSMIGIPVGSTLVFVKDTTITCITRNDDNKIEYKGKIYTMSKLATELLKVKFPVQGGLYFMYNGEVLTDIRNRLGI